MRKIITVLLTLLLAADTAQAYAMPRDHVVPHISEYGYSEVGMWVCSEEHVNQPWAKDNLRQLAITNTNNGNLTALRMYMIYHMKGTDFILPQAALDLLGPNYALSR